MMKKMKKNILFILTILLLLSIQGCEVFVIKGKKIVVEDQAAYTQTTPIGVVTIFINELANDNILAASEMLIKDGKLLTATEKYETTSELGRMKRFLDNKQITRQTLDTALGVITVTLELDYKHRAKFATQEINSLFYILNYEKE